MNVGFGGRGARALAPAARAGNGALAGAIGAACMTVIRMAARRRGIIDKTVPQAVEEWLAERAGVGGRAHPTAHHLADQALHLGYGATLGVALGLASRATRGRSRAWLGRGLGFGAATWLLGSWVMLPLLGAKGRPWQRGLRVNAIDLLAHLAFGAATSIVAEELAEQSDRGPTPDSVRHRLKIG